MQNLNKCSQGPFSEGIFDKLQNALNSLNEAGSQAKTPFSLLALDTQKVPKTRATCSLSNTLWALWRHNGVLECFRVLSEIHYVVFLKGPNAHFWSKMDPKMDLSRVTFGYWYLFRIFFQGYPLMQKYKEIHYFYIVLFTLSCSRPTQTVKIVPLKCNVLRRCAVLWCKIEKGKAGFSAAFHVFVLLRAIMDPKGDQQCSALSPRNASWAHPGQSFCSPVDIYSHLAHTDYQKAVKRSPKVSNILSQSDKFNPS